MIGRDEQVVGDGDDRLLVSAMPQGPGRSQFGYLFNFD